MPSNYELTTLHDSRGREVRVVRFYAQSVRQGVILGSDETIARMWREWMPQVVEDAAGRGAPVHVLWPAEETLPGQVCVALLRSKPLSDGPDSEYSQLALAWFADDVRSLDDVVTAALRQVTWAELAQDSTDF